MKKIIFVLGLCLGITIFANAATTNPKKLTITNTRIVQAGTDTTVDYAGVKVFVPKGQTVLLGQRSDGMVVIRGNNLSNIKLGDSTLSAQGYSVMSYQPKNQVVFLNRGTDLTVQDLTGNVATIYPGQAASTNDAKVTSVTAPQLQAAAEAEAAAAGEVASTLPAFVAESEISQSSAEQAAQDVEETETVLSNSTR